MTDDTLDIANHHYMMPEVNELPLTIDEPLDFLSAAQRRDVRSIQADSYYDGRDDFADNLSVDYGRVI